MKLMEIKLLASRYCMDVSPVNLEDLTFTIDSEKCVKGG